MSNRTRIVVLHMKEVIYTLVFAALAVILILLLLLMFGRNENEEAKGLYQPGVYTSSIQMNDATIEIEVVVDEERIKSIGMKNLSQEVATMYPLMQPCMDVLSQHIYEKQSVTDITLSEEGEYTSQVLLDAIKHALSKAEND